MGDILEMIVQSRTVGEARNMILKVRHTGIFEKRLGVLASMDDDCKWSI